MSEYCGQTSYNESKHAGLSAAFSSISQGLESDKYECCVQSPHKHCTRVVHLCVGLHLSSSVAPLPQDSLQGRSGCCAPSAHILYKHG